MFEHDPTFYKCNYCPMRTRTEIALHYHIDMKHNVYWEVLEEAQDLLQEQRQRSGPLPNKTDDDINTNTSKSDEVIDVKIEQIQPNSQEIKNGELQGLQCDNCDKNFLNERGLGVHMGRMHKDIIRKKQVQLDCDTCDWNGSSQEHLDKHKQEAHIELLKRKITQEQPNRYYCYICGYISHSETAFKLHTEERHNQDYSIQRNNSFTKSPPLKKSKDSHPENMDTETSVLDKKEEEIKGLKETIRHLEQKLELKQKECIVRQKQSEHVVDNVEVIEVKEATEDANKPKVTNESTIDKKRPYKYQFKLAPSEQTISMCSHRDEIYLEDIPEFPYICETCQKGFTHKGNLQKHKNDHKGIPNDVMTPQDYAQIKNNLILDKTKHTKKVHFSDIHNCEKCGDVFINKPLLEEHMNKNHNVISSTGAQLEENKNIPCGCVYPCIPLRTSKVLPVVRQSEESVVGQSETPVGAKEGPGGRQLQYHCALEDTPACRFQSESKEEFDRHIKRNHKEADHLQCSVCSLYFRDINHLSKHIIMTHNKEALINCNKCEEEFMSKTELDRHILENHFTNHKSNTHNAEDSAHICRNCDNYFETKRELDKHIIDYHKSHKPCRTFATNSCDYEECRYNHVILKDKERICYKCGKKVKTQVDLRLHMNEKHGDIVCKKFLENKCSFGTKCMFSHTISHVQDAQFVERHAETRVPTAQDFRHPLTTLGPVEDREDRAQLNQMQHMQGHNQQQIVVLTTQVMSQIMPLITNQVATILKNMNPNIQ